MHTSRFTSRRLLAGTAGLAVVVATLGTALPAHANQAGTGLVISEVYLNGGSVGATYTNKYVELYNPSSAPIDLTGYSVQYRSATGTATASTSITLTGTVASHDYYVLTGASNGSNGVAVPNADQSSGLNPSGTAGTLFLASGTAAVNPGTPASPDPSVVDLYGYGTSNMYEGTAGPAASVTTSDSRNATATDTDNNAGDFSAVVTTPGTATGTAPPPATCTGAGTNPTIAEIQGTDTTISPCQGKIATTTGVVTAAYPTGGFFGYVIQTDGTGTGTDATPGASDAVYVYQPSGTVTAAVGDLVTVTGTVSEFGGLTELTVAAADLVDKGVAPLGVKPLATAYPTTDAAREAHESELLAPTNQFTVTDNYSTNQYGEIGLATGDHQLVQPTDVHPASDTAGIAAVTADNAARGVVLDDGSSWNYLTTDKNTPMAWLSTDNPVRIGSSVTLHSPVILDYRNGGWDFQPLKQVTGQGAPVATFGDTRTPNQAPQPVGGNLRLATFNVENFFPTSAADYVSMNSAANACTSYADRTGTPITVRQCTPNGPRGAWDGVNLQRQLVKEVKAINTMDADVVSLEEIENSVQFGKNRDDALGKLVDALNVDAGKTRWAFVPSPTAANLPPTAEQDVIRTAFIYNPATVVPVGASVVLSDQSDPGKPFANAREPLAQDFKRVGAQTSDGFAVIVNHLKSKGDSTPVATGDNANGLQGAFNGDRVRQAHALVDFANAFSQARGTNRIFLVGDFNSYTQEDPMQVLYGAGYVNQASDDPKDVSYEFSGLAGSLDHVLANPAAAGLVTGRDVWQINAEESVGFEYSRYNYNATLLYQANKFRASDHNPEVVGLNAPLTPPVLAATTTTVSPVTLTYGHSKTTTVRVTSPSGGVPTGKVTLRAHGKTLGSSSLSSTGKASIRVKGSQLRPGRYTLTASYAGDFAHAASTGTSTLVVQKATPRVLVSKKPRTAVVHRTHVVLRIEVASAQPVHGTVRVSTGGHVYRAKLVRGKVTITLKAFGSTGRKKVVVRYLGNSYDHAVRKVVHLRVHH